MKNDCLFRVVERKTKFLFYCGFVLTGLLIWLGMRIYTINNDAFRQNEIISEMGDTVNLDGNFFFDSRENTEGYSICVNKTEIVEYIPYMKKYGKDVIENPEMPISPYIFLVNLTVKNKGNTNGYLNTTGFSLVNGSLLMPIDYEIWNIIDSSIAGNIFLVLRRNSEATLTIPFTAQPLDVAMNKEELERRIKKEEFYFCISEFPTRKLIKVMA